MAFVQSRLGGNHEDAKKREDDDVC